MSENTEIITPQAAEMMETVLVDGDLSKLTPQQRFDYYREVCRSLGLNPLTKPFDYINLSGRLTLYARKDATDQLRKKYDVNIDDVSISTEGDIVIVTVKGSNRDGRHDVEIGAVNKKDLSGKYENVIMKAVTKAKRRLTLSLCGLGWIDESEIDSIPQAKANVVNIETGELIPEKKALPDKQKFEEEKFLREKFSRPDGVMAMSYDNAVKYKSDKDGRAYVDMSIKDLYCHWLGLAKKTKDPDLTQDAVDAIGMKISAICAILEKRRQDLLAKDQAA